MLARKAELQYVKSNHVILPGKSKRLNRYIIRTVFIGFLVGLFLALGLNIAAIQSAYSYELMQKKQQVQDLQQENDYLRVDIARLETPERIYTMATKQLGMVSPSYVLYAPVSDDSGAAKSR